MTTLNPYRGVLTPDFSMYLEMPAALQLYNTFRYRWCEPILLNFPLRTNPALVFTFVGSVSISRFSSSCRTYFATVLALMPVYCQIFQNLGQH